VQERPPKPKKRTKRRDDDDDDRRRPTQRKRKRKVVIEQDLSELPPEQGGQDMLLSLSVLIEILCIASKIRLDMQIEAILKSKKASRPKKRKKDAEEEVLDRFADEEVSRLRESMLAAAAEDVHANKEKLPATAKLKLLPQVMEVLRK
jgi:transcription factor SPN1